jgi:hypothetical protein
MFQTARPVPSRRGYPAEEGTIWKAKWNIAGVGQGGDGKNISCALELTLLIVCANERFQNPAQPSLVPYLFRDFIFGTTYANFLRLYAVDSRSEDDCRGFFPTGVAFTNSRRTD